MALNHVSTDFFFKSEFCLLTLCAQTPKNLCISHKAPSLLPISVTFDLQMDYGQGSK